MPATRRGRSAKRSLQFNDGDSANPPQSGTDDIVDLTGNDTPQKKKRRGISDFFGPASTPQAKTASSAAIVTPQEAKKQKTDKAQDKEEDEKEQEHVPTYLHKNVEYLRKGEAELSDKTQKIYNFVEKHFAIPNGFENDRSFGPLSGVCYEERAIVAYTNNLLKPKNPEVECGEICTCCAMEGHSRDDCPALI